VGGIPAGHPAPEIPQRPAEPDEIPRTAAGLIVKAGGAGWETHTTFTRGTTLEAGGRPGRVVDAVAVRLRRDPLRLVAFWHDGKFVAGVMCVLGARGWLRLKSRELTALVTAAPS
jgi:hypothetical protein